MDIAIVGVSCRLPGGANNMEKLWTMLADGRSAWGKVPKDRFNSEAFYHPDPDVNGTINTEAGHFLDHDVSQFDAPFFGISPNEAQTMDPQQRLLLESAYEGLENAGIPLQSVAGSKTAVYAAIFSRDYLSILSKDTADMGKYYMTGVGDAILANRVSYLFDLKGPSVTLDTGCSGSLVAIHLASQSLRTGESDLAIASGVNLILHPDQMIPMSLMHILNSDGKSYTFDSRGSGYGRGEGVGTLILKRLDDAIRAGDNIRAVIRGSGCNSDGKTSGIALPNQSAQEDLARSVYASAGLDPTQTPYIEAHGTGTEAGDVIEINGIANVFAKQTRDTPLYVGSIKSNVGHLEAVSGIAGVLKSILILEKGKIPPQLNLKELKKDLPLNDLNLKVALELEDFPADTLRRISVASFGYGGTNAHLILEQFSPSRNKYLRSPRLRNTLLNGLPNGHSNRLLTQYANRDTKISANGRFTEDSTTSRQFLVPLSARSEYSLRQTIDDLASWTLQDAISLNDLEYTLSTRRSQWQWRASAVVSSQSELTEAFKDKTFKPYRVPSSTRIMFLFTGQGAQWYAMGRELLFSSDVFAKSISRSGEILQSLGASWDLRTELLREPDKSRVDQSVIGQPASTALQIALVDHLASLSIHPNAVLGHSSGEIAAAYAAGALTQETAMAISYHRSFLSQKSQAVMEHQGSMAVVGLSEAEANAECAKLETGVASVACLNDPQSTTISGDEVAIDELLANLDQSIFTRKLKVDTAYHSHHMEAVAQDYLYSMHDLRASSKNPNVQFVSSVTANVKGDDFGPAYWVDNLVSAVRFSDALQNYCRKQYASAQATHSAVSHIFIEIGPHRALEGPCKRTVQSLKLDSFPFSYVSALVRGVAADRSALKLVAKLFEQGVPVDLAEAINYPDSQPQLVANLPSYAWDKRTSYWHESRMSREHRLRAHPPHDLLGVRAVGNNPQEPMWRNILSLEALPWLKDHVIDGEITFPGTGYITMAVEAIRQLQSDFKWPNARKYHLRDIEYTKTLIIPESLKSVEATIRLYRPKNSSDRSSSGWYSFQISSIQDGTKWNDHCTGAIMIDFETGNNDAHSEDSFNTESAVEALGKAKSQCTTQTSPSALYGDLTSFGNDYGSNFAVLEDVHTSDNTVVATIKTPDIAACMPGGFQRPHVVHPATIDALLHMQLPMFIQHGGSSSVVPIRIEHFAISAKIANNPGDVLFCYGHLTYQGSRTANADAMALQLGEDGKLFPVIEISGGELRAIGEAEDKEGEGQDNEHISLLQWGEHIDFLKPETLQTPESRLERQEGSLSLEEKEVLFTELATWYIHKAVRKARENALSIPDTYQKWYFAWMERYTASHDAKSILKALTDERLKGQLQIAAGMGVEGETLTRLGESLADIATGQVSSLDVFMEGDLYYRMYSMDPSLQCAKYLSEYIKHLYHERGPLNVLEVGGGTGTTTKTLFEDMRRAGIMPFRRYDFTDISSGFFEQAENAFAQQAGIMRFKTFNAENSPKAQGFDEGAYDLVVGANVIHATRKLKDTLDNVRSLLNPGGRLAMIEVVRVTPAYNAAFGAIPGWWNGVEDDRVDTPLLSIEKWHERLLGSSFSGADIALRDSDSPAWMSALMISKAPWKLSNTKPYVKLVISPYVDSATSTLADEILHALQAQGHPASIESFQSQFDDDAVHIVFDSGVKPLLLKPSDSEFEKIKALVSKSSRVFWISAQGDSKAIQNPEKAFITGFSRTARSEYPRLRMVLFDVQQDITNDKATTVSAVVQAFTQSFCSEDALPSENFEYAIRDNRVYTPRLAVNSKLNSLIAGSKPTSKAEVEVPFHQSHRPLRLHVEKPGLLDSMVFVDDETKQAPLQDDLVEIQVMACGINFKDVFIALGQMKATTRMVGECAGVITAVGAQWKHEFRVGDRVCAYNGTAYSSTTRVSGYTANHIPDSISFETAASIPVVFATAHRSLVDVANLQKGESVLIHAGAGGVGQAAIIIAQHIGARVFATVGSEAKRQMLVERYNLPEDHIFSSRDRSFKDSVLRLTQGNGVDVVLNSLSGEALQDSWACIAKFGTFVEIGKADIYRKSLISMQPFDQNVTFTSVDLVVMADFRPKIMKVLLNEVIERFADGRYQPVFPITIMKLGEIEDAFRMIQSRKHAGKLVLTSDTDVMVKATAPKLQEVQLDPNGTYVLAGGLGSVGKSLMRYMASHGAKLFAILTRRTLSAEQQQELDEEMNGMGAKAEVITCDVTNIDKTREIVSKIKENMPPIRGVVQAAVAFVDRVLETMTVDDWDKALQPKHVGSWNLAEAFRDANLGFFLMLSSCAVIAGTRGQANYNAGNAFQDALAQLSPKPNTYYCSLNLGLVMDSEIGSQQESIQSLLRQGCIPVTTEEYLNLCGYMMSSKIREDGYHNISMGFNRASLSNKDDLFTLKSSLFNMFPYPKAQELAGGQGGDTRKNVEALIASANSPQEMHEIVSDAIVHKMWALVSNDSLDLDTSIADLGVDSLIAIELKNWINRVFKATVQTSDILESATLRALAAKIMEKSSLRPGQTKGSEEEVVVSTSKDQAVKNPRNRVTDSKQDGSQEVDTSARAADIVPSANGTLAPTLSSDDLPRLPLPTLEDTFDSFMETAQAFGSKEELQRTRKVIEDFKKPGGVGQKLQARLRQRADDPRTKNWLGDIYAPSVWLNPRVPVRPISNFFVSHALSKWQHGQAERAALVSLTAFKYKQELDAGTVESECFNETPQCMNTHTWIFNTYRRPAVPMDVPEKHPGHDFVAVLRLGHLFKIDLVRNGRVINFSDLQQNFDAILNKPLVEISWASALTTDERTSWSQVRDLVRAENQEYLDVIEKSLFVVCLDEGSPSSSRERAMAFVVDDNINRWNDKMLQLIVMTNGVSATYCEHSMMDGPTLNQLNRRLEDAILSHQQDVSPKETINGATPPSFQYIPFHSNPEIDSHIDRCRVSWKQSISEANHDSFALTTFGASYLQSHRISAKSAFQIMIQMAARKVFGHNIPSWDPVLMRHFQHGRLELIQVVTPAVAHFCEIADNVTIPSAERKKAFVKAVASYTNGIMRAAQGKGWDRHLLALNFVIQDGEERPSFFTDNLYTRTRPGRLITSYTAVSGDPELGIVWNDPEAYFMHFEPHENDCRLDISHGGGQLDRFWDAFVESADVIKELLGPASINTRPSQP